MATVTYALRGLGGELSRDLSVYAYAGQQFADGVPPYLGILNRAGPLAHMIPALGVWAARLVGADELLGMRVLFLGLSVACVVLTYLVGRNAFDSRSAGLASAAALLCFAGFVEYAAGGPREKTPMVLLLLVAFWAMGRRRWVLAGVSLAAATLILQIAFFVGMPAVVVALAVADADAPRQDRLGDLLRVLAGGLGTLTAVCGYFLAVGAMPQFLEAFLLINARYTVANPLLAGLGASLSRLVDGYGLSLVVIAAGLVAVLALSVREARRATRTSRRPVVLLALGAATVGGGVWLSRDFDSWPDLFPLLPVAALGVGAIVAEAQRSLSPRRALALTLAFSLAATALAVSTSVRGRTDTLDLQRAWTVRLESHLPPGARIWSINAPQPLVLSGRRNPSRFQMFGDGLDTYVEDTYEGGLDAFVARIDTERPALVAIGFPRTKRWVNALQSDYRRVGIAPGWIWYASRSLPRSTVTDLRRAGPR